MAYGWTQYNWNPNYTSTTNSATYTYYGSYGQPLLVQGPGMSQPVPVKIVEEPKELTALEWLDEQIAEVCELAYAA